MSETNSHVHDCADQNDPEGHHGAHPDPIPSVHPVHGEPPFVPAAKDRLSTVEARPGAALYVLGVTTDSQPSR